MQVLLTVYYLVQLGEMGWREGRRAAKGPGDGLEPKGPHEVRFTRTFTFFLIFMKVTGSV